MIRRGLTLEMIVEAAAAEADLRGFDSLSLGAVAKRLKVQPPSLYNHVDGLDALRRALLDALGILADTVGRAAIGKSQDDALIAMGLAMRELARKRPGLYAATIRAHPAKDKEAQAASQPSSRPSKRFLPASASPARRPSMPSAHFGARCTASHLWKLQEDSVCLSTSSRATASSWSR